jgi:hypothetical protein
MITFLKEKEKFRSQVIDLNEFNNLGQFNNILEKAYDNKKPKKEC